MQVAHRDWTVPSESGEPLRVSSHTPADQPRAHIVFAHGLKGFKEYGFIPVLSELLARRAGVAVHRFNFSHSGIGDDASTFQRADLFERDTWRLQSRDTLSMMRAVRDRFDDPSVALMGHSRGGASTLLAAAECFEQSLPTPAAIITLSAPSALGRLRDRDRTTLLEQGWLDMPSARTGQTLRVGRAWLQEQIDDPQWHDLTARCASVECPSLVAHGVDDATVPAEDARVIAQALPDATLALIDGGDHVWNTPNPAPSDSVDNPSPQLDALADRIVRFLTSSD